MSNSLTADEPSILRDYGHLTNRQQQTVTEDLAVSIDVQLLLVMEKPTELAAYWSHCSTQQLQSHTTWHDGMVVWVITKQIFLHRNDDNTAFM